MNNDQLYFYNRGYNDCLAKFIDSNPAKTLTDEEIDDIWAGISTGDDCVDMHEFAKAILKKASEK